MKEHTQARARARTQMASSSFRFLLRCVPIPTVQIRIGLKCLWHKLCRRIRGTHTHWRWCACVQFQYYMLDSGLETKRTDECRHVSCIHKYHLCFLLPSTYTSSTSTSTSIGQHKHSCTNWQCGRTHAHYAIERNAPKEMAEPNAHTNVSYLKMLLLLLLLFYFWCAHRSTRRLFYVLLCNNVLFVAMRTHFTRLNRKCCMHRHTLQSTLMSVHIIKIIICNTCIVTSYEVLCRIIYSIYTRSPLLSLSLSRAPSLSYSFTVTRLSNTVATAQSRF